MSPNNRPTAAEAFLGPLVANRVCGECTICCRVLSIDALNKPAGVLCEHCTGHNCGIYESRPQACRDFHCAWRRLSALGDDARPDRLGVVFSLESGRPPASLYECVFIIGRTAKPIDTLDRDALGRVLSALAPTGLPVFLSWDGWKRLVHPSGDLAAAIVGADEPRSEAIAAAAKDWLQRYAAIVREFAPAGVPMLPPGH